MLATIWTDVSHHPGQMLATLCTALPEAAQLLQWWGWNTMRICPSLQQISGNPSIKTKIINNCLYLGRPNQSTSASSVASTGCRTQKRFVCWNPTYQIWYKHRTAAALNSKSFQPTRRMADQIHTDRGRQQNWGMMLVLAQERPWHSLGAGKIWQWCLSECSCT